MNEQKKQKLLEQYDDAAFALLMDEYAEEEGARLMAEFEAAQAAGQVPEMPAELDEQCRRMIRRDRAKKRGIRAARSFRKVAVKAAVAVLVFIGLMTTVVMSVDALRVPVLNFIVEHYEKYSTLTFNTTPQFATNASTVTNQRSLKDLLADGYVELYCDYYDSELFCGYENEDGSLVKYSAIIAEGTLNFDTEGAEYENITINSYEGFLIRKDGIHILWLDSDNGLVHSLYATDYPENELIDIANHLASGYLN